MNNLRFTLVFLLTIINCKVYCQNEINKEIPLKVTGYLGFVHPIATLQNERLSVNFQNSYTVGFPMGINVQKKSNMGFSLEITPFIVAYDSVCSVKSVVIHPGIYFPRKNGWTFTGRLAFETNGRFGFTPSVSKVVIKGSNPIAVTVPFSFRFGNNQQFSIGTAILFTIGV
ncbi:MAG: hypothetical protein A3D31_12555 [Candidatus Fluviicola riflensis]|nr:MAG: hypothetical protein A3D31_12555 [Candidatus Fluviicola riflensis]OGS85599.1 MAG: hypothetical protein A2724_09490 [Fluviicola sp. RIFCSPHIGHO2_01_FULL_43_53]OGS89522.1 MAG: hypothetical protein A3E30_03795 [Fluviicola sp. RIFCSPHIGHO2_12_FULL_43_24]